MPAEIIDLLSSPVPPAVATLPTSHAANAAKLALVEASPSEYTSFFHSFPNGALSQLTNLSAAPAPAKLDSNAMRLASQLNDKRKSEDDFWVLSDDTDIETLPKTVVSNPGACKIEKAIPVPALSGLGAGKGENDFYFLENDFDTTINSDDPFADPPVAKKRRMSSSPPLRVSKGQARKKGAGYGRSISNIEPVGNFSKASAWKNTGRQSFKPASKPDSDPIVFTSSPDPFAELIKRRKERRKEKSLDEDHDDIFREISTKRPMKGNLESESEGDDTMRNPSDSDLPDIGSIPGTAAAQNSQKSLDVALAKYLAGKAKQKKARDRAQKAEEKTAEMERKRLAKEEKAREKEKAADMAKANTLRTDKKVSTPEMIVDLPSSLDPRLLEQVRMFLGRVGAEISEYESLTPIVQWRRKVTNIYNTELGHWELAPLQVKAENHIMYIMSAQEFVDLATREEGIDGHVLSLKTNFTSSKIIYLIEGLTPWMRKNKNLKNRQFTAAVRGEGVEEEAAATQSKRRKKKVLELVDPNVLEDALLKMQVLHGVLIHHCNALVETAQWVLAFTQHISTIPYKTQKATLNTGFCMDVGQVKTGDGPDDTYIKMLQEIMRVTPAIAHGIAAQYPSVQELARGLQAQGPTALEDVRKCANKDGAFTDRRIGKAISKRVWRVFTTRDEELVDV